MADAQFETLPADLSTSDEAMAVLTARGVAAWRAWVAERQEAGPTPEG